MYIHIYVYIFIIIVLKKICTLATLNRPKNIYSYICIKLYILSRDSQCKRYLYCMLLDKTNEL